MSITTVKFCRSKQIIYTKILSFGGAIALFFSLCGCHAKSFDSSDVTWKTYKNSRYGFEFPYPSNWTTLPAPANDDGVALVSPQKKTGEIRSWAVNQLPKPITQEQDIKTTINPNFQTTQGVSGILLVEIDYQTSSMTLSLTQNEVKYYWQGRSHNQDFPDYYRLFYYIAQQYRIRQ